MLILRKQSSTGIILGVGGKFPNFKNNGVLRSAQTTTTKRSGVTTEKIIRWHGTIYETLNTLDLHNSWHEDWERIKNAKKFDSFGVNMDETRISEANGKLLK